MLKGLDPILGPDALYVLRAMGHGDDLIIADANFPAETTARNTIHGEPIRFSCDTARLVKAVLSLMPVDTFVDDALARMEVVGDPHTLMPVQDEVLTLTRNSGVPMIGVERFAFYERAKSAFAIFQTQERRFYGCFAIRKGVIEPGEKLPNSQ